jgi:excinuclease UvrABC nuclease subunit
MTGLGTSFWKIVGDSEAPQAIPEAAPTLYRHFNATGELLYVGRTIRPVLQRQHEHLKTKKWWNEVTLTNYERFSTVEELKTAELDAIRSEHPRYNLTHNGRRDR